MRKITFEITESDYERIKGYERGHTFYPVTVRLYEAVKNAHTVEPQEWISVKDRLPAESDIYWVTVIDTRFGRNLVYALAYDVNSKRWANGHLFSHEKVIAWMKREVPSPYKGE